MDLWIQQQTVQILKTVLFIALPADELSNL